MLGGFWIFSDFLYSFIEPMRKCTTEVQLHTNTTESLSRRCLYSVVSFWLAGITSFLFTAFRLGPSLLFHFWIIRNRLARWYVSNPRSGQRMQWTVQNDSPHCPGTSRTKIKPYNDIRSSKQRWISNTKDWSLPYSTTNDDWALPRDDWALPNGTASTSHCISPCLWTSWYIYR